MTVSQGVLFIGRNTQTSTLNTDPIALWTATGTAATEVQPIVDPTGPLQGLQSLGSYSLDGAAVPGSLVVALNVSNVPSNQLYATDPATGTPRLLAVPNLSTTLSGATNLTSLGPVVVFAASTTDGTPDLWRSDGTAGGTYVVPVQGASAAGVKPLSITAFDGGALFLGSGTDNTNDVFLTDGTTAGTREVAALPQPSPGATEFQPLGAVNGRELFLGPGPSSNQPDLYATDGTAAGTVDVTIALQGSVGLLSSATVGGHVLYAAGGSLNPGLYSSDGTAAGTGQVLSSGYADHLTSLGAKALFTLSGPATNSNALWVSDGTAAGTAGIAVAGLSQPQQLMPSDLTQLGKQVLFAGGDTAANGGNGTTFGLWVSDGTAAGTREIAPGTGPHGITALSGGQAYFAGTAGLYVTDGTGAGTRLIPGTSGLDPQSIAGIPSPLGFSGTQVQYDLAPTAAGTLQTRDLSAVGNIPLDLPDSRLVSFGDGSKAVFDSTGNAEDVARVYVAAYDRAPDLAGLLAYTRQLDSGTVSLAQIAAAAPTSAEFLSTNGALTDAQFVTRLYQNAAGRLPDAGGLSAYTGALASGESRGQLLLSLAESPEARLHSQSVAGNANDATVVRLYEAVDARAPDAGGRIVYASALDAGRSVAQIATAMLAGAEHAAKFGTPTNADFISQLYTNLLGRVADAGGLASYTADLNAGLGRGELVAGFVGSDEARLLTAPLTHQGYVSVP